MAALLFFPSWQHATASEEEDRDGSWPVPRWPALKLKEHQTGHRHSEADEAVFTLPHDREEYCDDDGRATGTICYIISSSILFYIRSLLLFNSSGHPEQVFSGPLYSSLILRQSFLYRVPIAPSLYCHPIQRADYHYHYRSGLKPTLQRLAKTQQEHRSQYTRAVLRSRLRQPVPLAHPISVHDGNCPHSNIHELGMPPLQRRPHQVREPEALRKMQPQALRPLQERRRHPHAPRHSCRARSRLPQRDRCRLRARPQQLPNRPAPANSQTLHEVPLTIKLEAVVPSWPLHGRLVALLRVPADEQPQAGSEPVQLLRACEMCLVRSYSVSALLAESVFALWFYSRYWISGYLSYVFTSILERRSPRCQACGRRIWIS